MVTFVCPSNQANNSCASSLGRTEQTNVILRSPNAVWCAKRSWSYAGSVRDVRFDILWNAKVKVAVRSVFRC